MGRLVSRTILGLLALLGGLLSACSSDEPMPPPLPVTEATVSRGGELAEGFGACGFCHSALGKPGAPLSGGRVFVDLYGEVPGPNITIADSGIGSWTEDDVRTLFRANLRPNEEVSHSPLHRGFEWISDRDLTALIGYLRTQPPAEATVERRGVSFFERNTTGFFRGTSGVTGYVPALNPAFRTEYGQYLADSIARCSVCHSSPDTLLADEDYLAGGREIEINGVKKIAPNISASKTSGIGAWSEEDVRAFIMTGRTPQGRDVDPAFCPIEFYRRAPPSDIDAVVRYIRTVPVVE